MVFAKIQDIVAKQSDKDPSEITMETNFREDLDADSLDLFQMINDIEDEFDVKIDDAEKVVTVGDAVKFVEEATKK